MEFVEVYRAADQQQAHMLKNMLVEDGVKAFVSGENLAAATDMAGWSVQPKIMVAEEDVKQANLIVSEFEENTRAFHHSNSDPDDELEDESDASFEWPKCQNCLRLQQTVCKECENSGSDFEPAEFVSAANPSIGDEAEEIEIIPDELKLLCPVCEEIFVPDFYCECEPINPASSSRYDKSLPDATMQAPFNGRTLCVLVLILAAIAISLSYFL